MNENQLMLHLLKAIGDGLAAYGVTGIAIKQSYQPKRQGVVREPAVYVHRLATKPVGSKHINNRYDADEAQMIHTEVQPLETTFQIDAWVKRDPANIAQQTASDLVGLTAAVINGEKARTYLMSQGIGMYRVTDIRNPYFIDDSNENETSPSFDITLTHRQVLTSTSDVAQTIETAIYRI